MNTGLSEKRYGVARLLKYIFLIIIIGSVFVPSIGIKSTVADTDITVVALISPYQFLQGQTTTQWRVVGHQNEAGIELLESIVGMVEVDVVDAVDNRRVNEKVKRYMFPIIMATVILSIATTVHNNKVLANPTLYSLNQKDINRLYTTSVITGFPTLFMIVELFAFSITGYSLLIYYVLVGWMSYAGSNDWHPCYLIGVICLVLLMILLNGIIQRKICKKDIMLIKEGARYSKPYEFPKFALDMESIAGIFSSSTKREHINVVSSDPVEMIQKYKKLLDEGIITEEEFKKKKAELLNSNELK